MDKKDQSKPGKPSTSPGDNIVIRGAREHNLKNVSLDIPRNQLVVFTGISGSGKSSLAFSTVYAEAQRRYLESVSPYARRLFNQMDIPEVDEISGLPPAVALQQQRGAPTTRSTVGSITTLSNMLRMLYSRAGDYPKGQSILYAVSFSPNTPEGACPECHGLGKVYTVTEKTMVPDDTLTIRERAIAAWPAAWHGQNLREILITLGYDIDIPWKDLPKKDRDWILYTEEQPVVPVYTGWESKQVQQALKNKTEPSYMGTFTGVKKYVLQTFHKSTSPLMKKRAAKYMVAAACPLCKGKKLNQAALKVTFKGMDIAAISALSFTQLSRLLSGFVKDNPSHKNNSHPEKEQVIQTIATDITARIKVLQDLGLGYLSCERTTPTLSAGELQRLRLATQVYSNLFGVLYVMDEPSAGLHPADTKALIHALDKIKAAGNSLFIVEHEPDVIKHADWIVDVGPGAGFNGGEIMYNGAVKDFKKAAGSVTARFLYSARPFEKNDTRKATGLLRFNNISRNNIKGLDVNVPLGLFTAVTGISGSGKSTLVSQAMAELLADALGQHKEPVTKDLLEEEGPVTQSGSITAGLEKLNRLVLVDQKAIGRTPRSNPATYTGLFDHVRKLFAATPAARAKKMDAGRFSFNMVKGRCATCEGEGAVMVELLFLPSVYSPCPVCKGQRYNEATLAIQLRHKNIAQVLDMTVAEALLFFKDDAPIAHALETLQEVGLDYLRLGQPATQLSGGEAQRIKLATELQRPSNSKTIYILDEPTTGLHPSDVAKLMKQLHNLVDKGNTVVVVEHDMSVLAAADHIIEMGPGAGDEGGKILREGNLEDILAGDGVTTPYLKAYLEQQQRT